MKDATKKDLAISLRKLLLKKPLSKITIGELSKEAEVNRQTFYYHFQDINDLLYYATEKEGERIVNLENFGNSFEEDFRFLLSLFIESEQVVKNVHQCLDKRSSDLLLNALLCSFVGYYVKKESEGIETSEEIVDKVTFFYVRALRGVILEFICSSFQSNIDLIAKETANIIRGNFRNSILNLKNPF